MASVRVILREKSLFKCDSLGTNFLEGSLLSDNPGQFSALGSLKNRPLQNDISEILVARVRTQATRTVSLREGIPLSVPAKAIRETDCL